MNIIKSALHNMSASENRDSIPAYHHGLVVGIVSAIMQERRLTFSEAVCVVCKLLPDDAVLDRIPPVWHDEFRKNGVK